MKKALFICGGWDGHQPVECAEIFAPLLRAKGFETEIVTTLDVLLDGARISGLDLIVPVWTMGQISNEQRDSLSRAVASGIGLGGWHGGMGDSFRWDTTYQFMVGGQFVAHPDNHKDYVVNIVKSDDPIVAGLKDFTIHSEQYYMHVDPGNEVLATTTFQTQSARWVNGTVMPVVWKRRWDQGRVFYSSLGHNAKDFEVAEARELTLRGLLWASR